MYMDWCEIGNTVQISGGHFNSYLTVAGAFKD